jgi:hypothetical protein
MGSVTNANLDREKTHFRLASVEVGLDQDFSNTDVLADVTDGLLHGLAGPQNRDTADFCAGQSLSRVVDTLRGFDGDISERQEGQGVFDGEPDEALRVENKFITGCFLVPDESVQPLDLRGCRQCVYIAG